MRYFLVLLVLLALTGCARPWKCPDCGAPQQGGTWVKHETMPVPMRARKYACGSVGRLRNYRLYLNRKVCEREEGHGGPVQ